MAFASTKSENTDALSARETHFVLMAERSLDANSAKEIWYAAMAGASMTANSAMAP
jgi:hypothetical protein